MADAGDTGHPDQTPDSAKSRLFVGLRVVATVGI
jgi:hypothetical protein